MPRHPAHCDTPSPPPRSSPHRRERGLKKREKAPCTEQRAAGGGGGGAPHTALRGKAERESPRRPRVAGPWLLPLRRRGGNSLSRRPRKGQGSRGHAQRKEQRCPISWSVVYKTVIRTCVRTGVWGAGRQGKQEPQKRSCPPGTVLGNNPEEDAAWTLSHRSSPRQTDRPSTQQPRNS